MFKKTILKNGLRIITIPMKNTKTVNFLVLVGVGSKYETKEINGISHFLEHMFFKGTKKRSNTLEIAETLDRVGGEYNAFTSNEMTGYWAKVASPHQDIALEWVSDIFLNSKLETKEIEREKGVIIEELNMYLDTPVSYISDLWEKVLYGNQPAGWRVIGEKENIQNMTRNKLVDYLKNHYTASNTIVCAAGDISPRLIEDKIEKHFKKISNIVHEQKIKVKEKQEKPESLVYFKETDQTHLCLGVRAYNLFHPQKYALILLATILGGNMSSRLFIKIRERKGLAYYVRTSPESNTDTGCLVTSAGVDHKNVGEVIRLILKEYRFFKNNLITKEELKKAKDYYKGNVFLSLESSDSQSSFYTSQELLKKEILSPNQIFKKIDRVTINDIKKVAEDIFKPKKLNLALIGPFKEKEKFNKLLKI
ncbi:insulinase family protein [Patescibacteria group bacterium]|nr:insulinase family protein [Patescibacteria group bacterium]MBU4367450.1 insulinase family protein [Patescibacteria group bacterium]MBU4461770.1 insulinase family protein [Patescibacteria group bacterium]MCG2700154.1 insulinase family protein [Candidatus Parcubacteria bacterium]